MTYIKFIKLVMLKSVSAAIHTDTHLGATKNVLLEQHITQICAIQKKSEQHFFDFCISVKIGPK
jgi:hypothetical protein